MKFKVKIEYRGTYSTVIEDAECEEDARTRAHDEASEQVVAFLETHSESVKEIKE